VSLLFLAGVFEFGEGLLRALNAHGEGAYSVCQVWGGWLFLQLLLRGLAYMMHSIDTDSESLNGMIRKLPIERH
jgi:hypothetical protein